MSHDPEPAMPEDGWEARIQANFARTSARLAAERRERFSREYDRLHPREGRHMGRDQGGHHLADAMVNCTVPYQPPGSGCGCSSCQANPPAQGTPVDAELDELVRQRDADPYTAYERGRAEARSAMDAARGPMSASEAMARLYELRVIHEGPDS